MFTFSSGSAFHFIIVYFLDQLTINYSELVLSAVSELSCSVDDRANAKNARSLSQRVAARVRGGSLWND